MTAPSSRLLAALLGLAMSAASDNATLPEFLTWKELQVRQISSKSSCMCANSSTLEGLVKVVGGRLCLPRKAEDTRGLSTTDPRICFPPDYGVGECRMWDAGVGQCATENPEPWCFHIWCFVDPHRCVTGDVSESTFFKTDRGGNLHFSYMTCGLPQGDNPHYSLYVPIHLSVAAILLGAAAPMTAFAGWLFTSRRFPEVLPFGLPWVMMWLTVSLRWAINMLQLHERVPLFPGVKTTDAIFQAVVLFFLLLLAHRVLDMVDAHLKHWRFAKHKEDGQRKELQILESVLLYQKLHMDSWPDIVRRLWLPCYRVNQQVFIFVWVLQVLDVPVLSSWATTGLAGTFALAFLGTVFSFKDDIVAAFILSYEQPFKVADIVSLHTVSNNANGVTAAVAVGFVESLGISHIGIRNFDMRLQYVPTGAFARGTIRNWSARRYKTSHWTLVMSMMTPPEKVKAFRDAAEKALRSHPSCKGDGYIKMCVKALAGGGFELEVICFTKPHADHHTFKLDMNMTFSKLATRLGIHFVWQGISRESAVQSVSAFQCTGAEVAEKPQIEDLLFSGRFTAGLLVGKFKKERWARLARSPEQLPTEASIAFDMIFTLPLTNPVVVADKEIRWTEDHPKLKGELQVVVDVAVLQGIMPRGSIFGGMTEMSVAATVVRKGGQPPGGAKGGTGDSVIVQGAGDTVVASSTSNPRRVAKNGEATWGETLMLGEVELDRPGNEAGSICMLQLVVGRKTSNSHFAVAGLAEMPLLELVQDAWKDQRVKVAIERGDAPHAASA